MKYLLMILLVGLAGCTIKDDSDVRQVYVDGINYLETELKACKAELESKSELNNSYSNPESTYKDPEYEEIYIYVTDGTRCKKHEETACGSSFWECKDDFVRECMKDSKYKIETERVLVE